MFRLALVIFSVIFSSQNFYSQVTFSIQQNGCKKDSLPEIIIGNFLDVIPQKINDTTLEYAFVLDKPEYLFIVVDRQNRWVTRLWITPEMKHAGLIVDYSSKIIIPEKLNEWDIITQKVFDFQDAKKTSQADSMIVSFVEKNYNSFFSLWLLRFMTNKKTQLSHLDKLSPKIKEYSEYRLLIATLTGRKYPNVGDPFTEFSLVDKNDSIFSSLTIKNKWILLIFWSNGCAPCVKEMDDLVKLYKSIDTSKIEFISIGLDEDKNKWKAGKASQKIIWTSVWAEDNVYCKLCLNYNLYSMPFFILFNNDKKLIFIKDGSDELENIKQTLLEIK